MKQQGVLDFGNTKVKVAIYEDGKQKKLEHFSYSEENDFRNFLNAFAQIHFIYSSVIKDEQLHSLLPDTGYFHDIKNLKLPLNNKYASPETLGEDRICNAVALQHYAAGKNALCIDLGTCLKFDFKNANDEYLGGSISPGIRMRFKAMNFYTGKLPFIEHWTASELIGRNSIESMTSGVINGIEEEIKGFIHRYAQSYPGLTIFMTGGDSDKLQLDIKNPIFADSTFTLKGLQLILDYNEL